MAMPSEPVAADGAVEDRRLHPLSWLFVLLQQLRSFAVPLILLVVTGRRSSADFFGLVGVGGLVVMSVIQYLTYRYRPGNDSILIRSGVFQRTTRDIPYERIHNVTLHQSLLHRLFAVAEVRLESAGSNKAEATMRVLALDEARALETVIRDRGHSQRAGEPHADGAMVVAESQLLSLDTAELVRLGLISNRGLVVVAALFGFSWQFMGEGRALSRGLPAVAFEYVRDTGRLLAEHIHDVVALVVVAVLLVLTLLVVVRLLSVMLSILQFHGFSLVENGRQLRVERGLLTRVRHQLPRRRIQAWRLSETLIHRWFNRRSLRVDSAAANSATDDQTTRHLAPIATPEKMDALIVHLLPHVPWPPDTWQPLHPRAWRRMFLAPTVLVILATAGLTWWYGGIGLLVLGLVPLLIVRARAHARHGGYAEIGQAVAVRTGWLSRNWGLVEIDKLQSIRLTQSPLDRRHGMATIWFDTAGAGTADGVLRISHLPVGTARRLHDRLASTLDASPAAQDATDSAVESAAWPEGST